MSTFILPFLNSSLISGNIYYHTIGLHFLSPKYAPDTCRYFMLWLHHITSRNTHVFIGKFCCRNCNVKGNGITLNDFGSNHSFMCFHYNVMPSPPPQISLIRIYSIWLLKYVIFPVRARIRSYIATKTKIEIFRYCIRKLKVLKQWNTIMTTKPAPTCCSRFQKFLTIVFYLAGIALSGYAYFVEYQLENEPGN